ncbi:sensor histidine kinase [Cellulomonas sp. APG4]|uniref:sensor histidine kinase n=1 Tax=Cellulomonas sp. APG4 TaxID=1538656 RepID=UPI00351BDD63
MRWWERVGAWDETNRFTVDAAWAALTALVVVPASATFDTTYGTPAAPWIALGMCVALAWRRVRPAASAAAVFTVGLFQLVIGVDLIFPADLLVLVALYSVTVHGPRWAYRTAILGALAGSAGVGALALQGVGLDAGLGLTIVYSLCAVATFAIGLVRRSRREMVDSLRDRARRLEVERDQQARIATAAERARIAREMHDIVAHSLSVIIAQADGGRYAAAQDPDAATRSLTTIGETGRAALADMRRLLGVLRPTENGERTAERTGEAVPSVSTPRGASQPPPAPQGPADLVPQPAVGDVETLVEQVRGSGVRISLVRMGVARPLPPGTGLTVYRICQESLTNILKHAGPEPTATVLVQWTARSLVLEVTDDGRGAAADAESDGAGQGVLGMRERAAMLGGTLTVGPRPGGGYRVRAEIPIPALEESS